MSNTDFPSTDELRLFPSFFMGGFDCASHQLLSGRRLDLTAATGHDRYAFEDYQRLREYGIEVARDGIRWHLVEPTPYCYDFSSVLPMLRAARETHTQIIWDLCHTDGLGDRNRNSFAEPSSLLKNICRFFIVA